MTKQSQSELVSAELYTDLLQRRGFVVRYSYADPPDWIFQVSNINKKEKYAVEVTEIHELITNSPKMLSRHTFLNTLDSIKNNTIKSLGNTLNEEITVRISFPLEKKEKDQLSDEIIKFVKSNRKSDRLFGKDNLVIKRNENNEADLIFYMVPKGNLNIPGTNIPFANVQERVNFSFNKKLDSKINIIKKLSNFDKKVLILYGSFMGLREDHIQCSIKYYNSTKSIKPFFDELYFVQAGMINDLTRHI